MNNSLFEINVKLSLSDIEKIITSKLILKLSDDAKARIIKCRSYLDNKLNNPEATFYGINTGFGSLCNTRISSSELQTLQENLLRSHACGMGDYVPREIVKLMLLLKIQSLSFGHSGVQLETVERLIDLYNADILPVVFEQGSLGASGDLAPLAHLCLPLLGEGKVWYKMNLDYEMMDAADVLKKNNLTPIKLKSKEGLALINGTQFMSAYGVYLLLNASRLINWANIIAAISLDAFDGRIEPFSDELHAIRPHAGQVACAKKIRTL